MIISIDAEKSFKKTQHPFRIETLNKVGIEKLYLSILKAICDNSTVHIQQRKTESFPLKI